MGEALFEPELPAWFWGEEYKNVGLGDLATTFSVEDNSQ